GSGSNWRSGSGSGARFRSGSAAGGGATGSGSNSSSGSASAGAAAESSTGAQVPGTAATPALDGSQARRRTRNITAPTDASPRARTNSSVGEIERLESDAVAEAGVIPAERVASAGADGPAGARDGVSAGGAFGAGAAFGAAACCSRSLAGATSAGARLGIVAGWVRRMGVPGPASCEKGRGADVPVPAEPQLPARAAPLSDR